MTLGIKQNWFQKDTQNMLTMLHIQLHAAFKQWKEKDAGQWCMAGGRIKDGGGQKHAP